jgi:hypothetical protein
VQKNVRGQGEALQNYIFFVTSHKNLADLEVMNYEHPLQVETRKWNGSRNPAMLMRKRKNDDRVDPGHGLGTEGIAANGMKSPRNTRSSEESKSSGARSSAASTSKAAKSESKSAVKTRKPNGIKGITVEQKSNDKLRDQVLEILNSSGIKQNVSSKIVFAHTGKPTLLNTAPSGIHINYAGIYIGDNLFCWCGPGGLSIRCHNKTQKTVCEAHGCTKYESANHGGGNYYCIPENVYSSGESLRRLAEEFIAVSPIKKK